MKFFRLLMVIAAITFAFQGVNAQGGKGKGKGKGESHGNGEHHGNGGEHGNQGKSIEQRAQNRSNQLQKKLALSADQTSKIYQAIFTHLTEMEKIKALPKGPDKHTQMQALQAQKDNAFKGILTADQYAQFQKMKEDREHGEGDHDGDDDDSHNGGSVSPNPKNSTGTTTLPPRSTKGSRNK